jgi:hypothetical protein
LTREKLNKNSLEEVIALNHRAALPHQEEEVLPIYKTITSITLVQVKANVSISKKSETV